MKIFISLLFTLNLFASNDLPADNRGMVIVLEAPLFRFPDEKSKVLKYVRKDAFDVNSALTGVFIAFYSWIRHSLPLPSVTPRRRQKFP